MKKNRESGILIHPTSFPSPYGIGDLGPGALVVLDFLRAGGQSLLQVLPLGPTGYADAPFSPFSSFAGNPYLLSFDILTQKGLLTADNLESYPVLSDSRVDYGAIYQYKMQTLRAAYSRWEEPSSEAYHLWRRENDDWLAPYCRFMAWKSLFGGQGWQDWPREIRLDPMYPLPDPGVKEGRFHLFLQWEFENQWQSFRQSARDRGITILGDLPLYVAEDSCDVWSRRDLFELSPEGKALRVAGVPPDELSPEGQRWGNPLYHWKNHKDEGFAWWNRRVEKLFTWVDQIKIDHFRGLESYWAIDSQAASAVEGEWVKAPGHELFRSWEKCLGKPVKDLFFAENLGFITQEVEDLLEDHGIPGMQVGTFFDWSQGKEAALTKLPEKDYGYSSTHDTQPLGEWLESLEPHDRVHLWDQSQSREGASRALVADLMGSPCRRVIFSIQDLFGLGRDERMNIPGTLGNWTWRLDPESQKRLPEAAAFLKSSVIRSGR